MTAKSPQVIDLSFLRDRGVQKRVATAVLVAASGGLLYGLLAPRWYRSEVVLMPTKQQKGGISSLLGSDLSSLGAGLDIGGGGADTSRIAAVLQSTAVADAAIAKFDLKARYGAPYQESAREDLWRHCDVRTISKPNLVQLSCEDKDPKFIEDLLGFLATYGNEVFRKVNVSSASEEVRYLERRVAELKRQADEAAARMREFQERNRIVDLDSQAKALVSSVATINSQRIAKEMELDYSRTYSSREAAGARQLESQLSVMDEKLRDLELPQHRGAGTPAAGEVARPGSAGMFPGTLEVPRLRAEYERLYRDRRVAEATLVFALDRLESARASEARDVSTFQVLDPPTRPTRKSRPRISLATLVGAALGLAIGLAMEWRRSVVGGGKAPGPSPEPG